VKRLFAEPDIRAEHRPDGTVVLQSNTPLGTYEPSLGHLLRRWSRAYPDWNFLAERPAGDATRPWRAVTYGEADRLATSLAQALLDHSLGPDRPLAVLSGNTVNHGLLMLAGYLANVPVVPVSPAYSLLATDFTRLAAMVDLVRPGLVYVEQTGPFAHALDALGLLEGECIGSTELCTGDGAAGIPFRDLASTGATPAVEDVFARVDENTIAKILFTSGSTGHPKGVITTQRMLCSNQQAMAQVWPFLTETPPVLCDWLPWSHTFGGSHNFNMVLWNGGTLYIDAGRPSPAQIRTTLVNLADVRATISFNVPVGFGALLPHLEADEDLAQRYFDRLQLIFYASAALPPDLWSRLEALAVKTVGHPVAMTSSWGATETAPAVTNAHFPLDRAGIIGVPLPGMKVKLVPAGHKQEVRVAGVGVTPGYLDRPDLTEAAFDEEGFYRIGDAMRLIDRDVPNRGLVFDGRIAEDFKLLTGTWVNVGMLRIELLAALSPLLSDLVVAGHDRDRIGLLVWLAPEVLDTLAVRSELAERLQGYNATHVGSASSIANFIVLEQPPSIDLGEITDKGYINQRAVLESRAFAVEALFDNDTGPNVVPITSLAAHRRLSGAPPNLAVVPPSA
jgi:feruloyl-CoA synthase